MTAEILRRTALDPAEQAAVRALADRAGQADGVAPLSEQPLLSLAETGSDVVHLVAITPEAIVGYAQVDLRGPTASAEIVVDPSARCRGVGSGLLAAVREIGPGALAVWAHGNLPGAQALAASARLRVVRELWRMHRPLDDVDPVAGDDGSTDLPAGLRLHPLAPGDEPRLLAVNARAFATHPEQGRMTMADLQARQAEPWFSATDVLLVDDAVTGDLKAFLWLKVQPGDPDGELYVLGVDPSAQGQGLGRTLTWATLRHLRARGCTGVTLYVDGDNTAAVRTYTAAGFSRAALDVQYAPA